MVLKPCLKETEIRRLAKIDNLEISVFEDRFVEKDPLDGAKTLKNSPCKYLSGKLCTIYNDRPGDCRSFPHTHKPDFTTRSWEMIDNCSVCPIVYNVWEGLKGELWRL